MYLNLKTNDKIIVFVYLLLVQVLATEQKNTEPGAGNDMLQLQFNMVSWPELKLILRSDPIEALNNGFVWNSWKT